MTLRSLLCGAVLAIALGAVAGDEVCNPVAEVRAVPRFDGVHADDGIKVNVTVSPIANASLRVSANADFLSEVKSRVDHHTLMLELALGKKSSCVMAEIQVSKPLLYASASSNAEMTLHSVNGSLAASLGGELHVGTLAAEKAVSIVADTGAEIKIREGKVDSLDVTCNNKSEVYLGNLKARRAVAFAAGESSVYDLTAGVALVSASGKSEVGVTATQAVILMCSNSEIKVRGSADVHSHASSGCKVAHNDTQISTILP